MMLGGGAIPDAIELCNREVYARGLKGDFGIGVALAAILLGSALGRRSNGVLRPHDIGVTLDGGRENRSDRLLVLATTLHRLILRSRPFWNYDAQPIRYTSIAYPPGTFTARRSQSAVWLGAAARCLPRSMTAKAHDGSRCASTRRSPLMAKPFTLCRTSPS